MNTVVLVKLPDEHPLSSTPEIPCLVDMIQTEHLITVLNQVDNYILIVEMSWFRINGSRDKGKFDLLEELTLDARSFTYSLPGFFQRFSRFQHEFEWNAMWLICFLVKVVAVDESVIIRSPQFVVRDLFCVQGGKLIDPTNIEIFDQLFVNLAAMNLKYSDIACCLFVHVELLGDAIN